MDFDDYFIYFKDNIMRYGNEKVKDYFKQEFGE